jgi:hypothetical protein
MEFFAHARAALNAASLRTAHFLPWKCVAYIHCYIHIYGKKLPSMEFFAHARAALNAASHGAFPSIKQYTLATSDRVFEGVRGNFVPKKFLRV